jgi:hypothetical protein
MLCPNCGQENASAFGYCAHCQRPLSTVGGAAAMPGLAAMASQKSKRGLIITIAVVALVAAGGAAYFLAGGSFESPEQRFSRLMREAAGLQPESHRGFGRQRRFDDAVRDQYRRLLQQNRDYVASVKQVDFRKVQVLNSPAGFADAQAEQDALDALHSLYGLDTEQEQKVHAIMGDLRHVLENYAGSAREREEMLRGFDASLAEQLAKRQEAVSSEKAFVDAIDDVHAYARAHRNDFSLNNGHLIFTDPAVREEFNAKVRLQDEKRNAFVTAERQFNLSQAQILGKMGLSQKDIGGK